MFSYSLFSSSCCKLQDFCFCEKVGERLGRYEVEKKKAVEMENYDLAMEKKVCSHPFYMCIMAPEMSPPEKVDFRPGTSSCG